MERVATLRVGCRRSDADNWPNHVHGEGDMNRGVRLPPIKYAKNSTLVFCRLMGADIGLSLRRIKAISKKLLGLKIRYPLHIRDNL